MKTLLIAVGALLCSAAGFAQSNLFPPDGRVGIGTMFPDTSAILQISSTHQGVLIPRMTKSQRSSIQLPAVGLLVYQTNSTPGFYFFNGLLWTAVSTAGANTSLSNLLPTKVNANLEPSADNTINLGTAEKRWNTVYVKRINIDGDLFVSNGNSRDSANTIIGATHNTSNTGGRNVWIGTDAGKGNTSGYDNAFVGYSAGKTITIGSRDCFFGMNAGFSNKGGLKNTFLGYNSGRANNAGLSNTFVGYRSGMKNTSAGFNAFFGDLAGNLNVVGTQNVYFGSHSGINATASNNTFVGYSSGAQVTTAANCTFIGANADATLLSATNSIAIGYLATVDQSNVIRLGDTDISKIGIGCSPLADDVLDFQVTTAKLTTGGAWTNASDRKLKNNFQNLDDNDILDRVSQLPIQRWHYTADRETSTHIGPVAQDFNKLFRVGDDTTISTIDPPGVALVAIQALTEKGQVKDATIANQQRQINELKDMISAMEQSLSQCCMNEQSSKQDLSNYLDGDYLEQNIPNPSSDNTIIKCYLTSEAKSATITISTLDGKEVKSFMLLRGGANEITLRGGSLPVGEYIYTLFIDGNPIDTKRMVLTQ